MTTAAIVATPIARHSTRMESGRNAPCQLPPRDRPGECKIGHQVFAVAWSVGPRGASPFTSAPHGPLPLPLGARSAQRATDRASQVRGSCRAVLEPPKSRSTTSRAVTASRLPVGSSANKRSGSLARARASATRCCSPPDSCPG
jgi:hypothetical protein